MKKVILTLLILAGTLPILNAQTAQETFEANLETLRTDLIMVEKTQESVGSEDELSVSKKFLFDCEDIEQTMNSVSEILKNKVALRADNKQKISAVLELLKVDTPSYYKNTSPECCTKNRKVFNEFCEINGLKNSKKN